MNKQRFRVNCSASLDQIEVLEPFVDSAVLRVCYAGLNKNRLSISKEVIENCVHTIYNKPVVCRYDREADTIGGHDEVVGYADEIGFYYIDITTPIGVVPESADYWWEEVEEENGEVREYLCVDVLLWSRQDAYRKVKENGTTSQSMEIVIKDFVKKDGVIVVNSFGFAAFCLLETERPCYESASLVATSDVEESSIWTTTQKMMEYLNKPSVLEKFSERKQISEIKEGVRNTVNKKQKILKKYNLDEAAVGVDIETLTEEEFEVKCQEVAGLEESEEQSAEVEVDDTKPEEETSDDTEGSESEPTEVAEEVAEPVTAEEPQVAVSPEVGGTAAFALVWQFEEVLQESLSKEKVEDPYWGTMPRFSMTDYDPEVMEVYCYDWEDSGKLCGLNYSMVGDNVQIDFNSKKRKKFSIVDFEEGTDVGLGDLLATFSHKHAESNKQWEKKFKANEKTMSAMSQELTSLRKFKEDTEEGLLTEKRGNVLESFSDLSTYPAFEALRSDCAKFSLEELEEKCFALRGRSQTKKFSLQQPEPSTLKIKINKSSVAKADNPYGDLFDKFDGN